VGKDAMIAREAKPIVVRTADIAYLEQYLETALTGERQVVFVSGPGIGKTMIVDTFLVRSKNNAGLRFGHGQCVEQYGAGEAFMPLIEIAGQLCRG
jgi:MoxR-like ATPase